MSGCIDLEYPFMKSWIWEVSEEEVIMSMIVIDKNERRKGHCSRLIEQLQAKYRRIVVPVPSNDMKVLLSKYGFVCIPANMVWEKEATK